MGVVVVADTVVKKGFTSAYRALQNNTNNLRVSIYSCNNDNKVDRLVKI